MPETTKPIELINARSLESSYFEGTEWGRALLREVDLVISQGALEAKQTGNTLYNDVINARVGDFVAHLDKELVFSNLGTFDVSPNLREGKAQEIAQILINSPRGTMAVLRTERPAQSGIPAGIGCDAWMSDGNGSLATESGIKFLRKWARTPETDFRAVYGALLSRIVYQRRNAIENAILHASVAAANLKPGLKIKGDHYLNGRSWTTATLEKVVPAYYVGGTDAWQIRMSKPGLARSFICEPSTLIHLFKLPIIMPSEYASDQCRLLSLHEKRVAAAISAWPIAAQASGIDPEGSRYSQFVTTSGGLERDVWAKGASPIGSFQVTFHPSTDAVSSIDISSDPVLRIAA